MIDKSTDIRDNGLAGVHLHCACECSSVHFYRWDETYLGNDWQKFPPLYHFDFTRARSFPMSIWWKLKLTWKYFRGQPTEDMTFTHAQVTEFRDRLTELLTEENHPAKKGKKPAQQKKVKRYLETRRNWWINPQTGKQEYFSKGTEMVELEEVEE